ncbi:MAG: BCCT family transporter [Cloacibacillus sp.]
MKSIRPFAFFPPFILLIIAAIFSLVAGMQNEAHTVEVMSNMFNMALDKFGWLYASAALVICLLTIYLACSRYGDIKFGGNDAKPEFTYWNWFAMTLCAGIAIGIVFWGVAEPIMQFQDPPKSFGIAPFSEAAARFSLAQIFLEWTFTPYAMYCVCGISCAYAFYNLKEPKTISSAFIPIFGDRVRGKGGEILDAFIIFALVGGVVTSLGEGVLQVASGLDSQFGIPSSRLSWGIISLIMVVIYTISSYTGINKGIRILSDINGKLFFFLLGFVMIVGPTIFNINIGLEAFASYIETFFSRHLFLAPVSGDPFPRYWTLFFFAIWYAWAPVTGMFLARMAYGRTVREFVVMNMLLPAAFGAIWFTFFGGTAMHMEIVQKLGIAKILNDSGVEAAMFAFLNFLPLAKIMVPIFFVVIVLSFSTAADSMTSTVALMCTKQDAVQEGEEAPAPIKLAWGILMGFIAWIVITFAKIDGLRMVVTLAAAPAALVVILQAASSYIMLKGHYKNEASEKAACATAKSSQVMEAPVNSAK